MGSHRTDAKPAGGPALARLALAAALAVLCLSVCATRAEALVTQLAGRQYGVTPIRSAHAESLLAAHVSPAARAMGATSARGFDSGGALQYHGGPVMHSVTTHVIYWDPGKEFSETKKGIVHKFFTDAAHDNGLASNVFGVAGQYTDGSGNAAYISASEADHTDLKAYPKSGCEVPKSGDQGPPYTHCLTDEQVRAQLLAYITANELPRGPAQQYFILLPHKVVTCAEEEVCSNNVFCAYHSVIEPGPGEVIYSDIPFSLLDEQNAKGCQADNNPLVIQHPNGDTAGSNASTRYADVALKYISHEYIEAATDPQPENGWLDLSGHEIGDKCNSWAATAGEEVDPNAFLPVLGGEAANGTLFDQSINGNHYYIQSEWDNGAGACSMRPVPLAGVGFTSAPASPGSPVSFSGTAVDDYSGLGFSWTFGDGGVGEGPSPTHTYAAPGAYKVTMTARDSLTGATAPPVERTVIVNDQPTASFTISPNPAPAGAAVAFDGSASSDTDGAIVTYSWDFGDGSGGGGAAPSHFYAGPGSYLVRLTVTDSGGVSATTTQAVTISAATAAAAPGSLGGTAGARGPSVANLSSVSATVDEASGVITFTESVRSGGTLSWLLTFQNGRFGAFASRHACKPASVWLKGKCRPARIVFAAGSRAVASAGTVSFRIKPTSSGLKALRRAFRQRKGVPVLAMLTFQPAAGGPPSSHAQVLSVRLKKR